MNDFTKKELRYLDYSLEQYKFSCKNEKFENELTALRTKIQSMIDNYPNNDCQLIVNKMEPCKHESNDITYIRDDMKLETKCKKCGEFYR